MVDGVKVGVDRFVLMASGAGDLTMAALTLGAADIGQGGAGAVAVAVFLIRYLALYRPQSSTDAVVVAILPFWWLPILALVTALSAAALWAVARRSGRAAFA